MAFRVIPGNPAQGDTKAEGADKTNAQAPRVEPPAQAPAAAPVEQLLERLEALSFTFEALNSTNRSYAAEAVLETLARMERRDLQSLAAIEVFAGALKTVSQHLAGLRNAVQTTAHETATGLDHIGQRLATLEQKAGIAGNAEAAKMLSGIASRLAGIENKVAAPAPVVDFDVGPITGMLDTIAGRVAGIEAKLEAAAVPPPAPAPTPAAELDIGPLNATLKALGRRMARLEKKIDNPAALELDATPLNDALEAIAQRVGNMEEKLAAITESGSTTTGLLAVDRRLARMEASLDLKTEQPAKPTLALAAPVEQPMAMLAAEDMALMAVADEGFASKPAPQVTFHLPPPAPEPAPVAPAKRSKKSR